MMLNPIKWFVMYLAKNIALYLVQIEEEKKVLSKQIVIAQRQEEEYEHWVKKNSKLIHRERAVAYLREENLPEIKDLYNKFKN